MSRGLTPAKKREIAERYLFWLKQVDYKTWDKTYTVLIEAPEALNEEVYNLWKAHDLLIILGKIERISPNGRMGCRVISYTSLYKPVPSDAILCKRENCPILKAIGEVFK